MFGTSGTESILPPKGICTRRVRLVGRTKVTVMLSKSFGAPSRASRASEEIGFVWPVRLTPSTPAGAPGT